MKNNVYISDEALFNVNSYFAHIFLEDGKPYYDIVDLYESASKEERSVLLPYLNELLCKNKYDVNFIQLFVYGEDLGFSHDDLPTISHLLEVAKNSNFEHYSEFLAIIFEYNNKCL